MGAETMSITVPEEPPHASVVLDGMGWSWQRFGSSWASTRPVTLGAAFGSAFSGLNGNVVTTLSWSELLVKHGPVTVIHRAPLREDAESAGDRSVSVPHGDTR